MDSIIFDLDGTLWDSTDIVAEAWNEAIRKHTDKKAAFTPAILKSLFGRTLPEIAAKIFPEETPNRQLELIDLCCEAEHDVLLAKGATLFDGLEEVLQVLSKKYPLFIVSNCEAGYIEIFLQVTGFGHYFTDHLCPGDTGNAKADNIREIIRRNQLQSAIYVGDTSGDYMATKRAGIPFVFAAYGFGTVAEPDYTITSLKELIPLFA